MMFSAAKDCKVVMCSRVKEPKVAIFTGDHSDIEPSRPVKARLGNGANIIVDGSAFHVPGKIVTGEYFCVTVKNDKDDDIASLVQALKMQMFRSVRDKTWNVYDPIYYVAVVQQDSDDFVYVHDLKDVQCYLAGFADGRFTFGRAIFGPGLFHELKEVLQ